MSQSIVVISDYIVRELAPKNEMPAGTSTQFFLTTASGAETP